jgi:uncharacterized protein YukE
MTDIVLKFNEAQQAVDELNAEAAKLEELTAEEGALVDQIAGSQWTGAGEGSWEQRQREWQKESVEESAALRRLVQAVEAAHGLMKDTETQVSGLFN